MNVHTRRSADDAINHAWLEKVASEMLAEADRPAAEPPARPAVQCAMDEQRPARRKLRAQQRKAIPRDGYGRPLRLPPVPAPSTALSAALATASQHDESDAERETPRTGHPLGLSGKVLLGAALTGVGMSLTSGFAVAEPVQDNNTTTSTPNSRPAPAIDVRVMSDQQLGQELGRVSGKDYLRTEEVVTEMKLRGTQLFEAAPAASGPLAAPVTGPFVYGLDGRVISSPSARTPQPAAPNVLTAGPAYDQAAAPVSEVAKPTVKVVVVGDSFTSGEGATSSTYRTVPVPVQTEDGITYQIQQIDPAHQSSTAPTLQALNQIQAANPGANIQVTFVPVSGATRDSLYQTTNPGTPFEQAPQINAVQGADVVIVGIGGNDARFADWVKTALTSTDSTSTQQFPQFSQQLNDGTYLANQTRLLNDISSMAAPNATIVSLGYPKSLPSTVPGTPTWYSPFSWSTISQGEADRSNELATTLNTNNQAASAMAASQHPAQQWLYADVATALQGHELLTSQEGLNGLTPTNMQGSYHPNDLGQQLLGSVLQPYVEQAVNNQLTRLGVQGAENVPPINPTFAYQWNLRVDVPLQAQSLESQAAQTPPAQPAPEGTNQPNATDQAQPDATQPDATQPDAVQPEATQPDATQPDATQPEAPQPDATQPDATQPDAVQSEAPQPDASQPEAAPGEVPAQPGANQSDATQPEASAEVPTAPVDTPEQAPEQAPAGVPTDPNADLDQDGVPNGQDATWNENNTDPTSTDVGDGPEGNPGYLGSTGTETGFSDSGFGANTNTDTGSGNISGNLDTGSNVGNPDTGSSVTDTGSGYADTGSGYSDSGFGNNTGSFDSGSSGSFDSGSSGSFDSGSSGSFDSGSSGSFDSGGGGFDSGGGF